MSKKHSSQHVVGWVIMPVLMALGVAAEDADAQASKPTMRRSYGLESDSHRQDETEVREQLVDPQTLVQGDFLQALKLLESERFDERESATQQIVELSGGNEEVIYSLLSGAQLSPEQRERLLVCLRMVLLETPRGALGIQMAQELVAGAQFEVVITRLIPGMPAEKVLKVDDRIVTVNDRVITAQPDLSAEVQGLRPGDLVRLGVKRARVNAHGEFIRDELNQTVYDAIEVELQLGSTDELAAANRRQGFAIGGSPVLNERMIRADQAAQELGVRPHQVAIGTGPTSRVFQPEGANDEHPSGAPRINVVRLSAADHPLVRAIKEEKLQVARGLLALTPELRAAWQERLLILTQAAEDENLNDETRAQIQEALIEYVKVYKNGPR